MAKKEVASAVCQHAQNFENGSDREITCAQDVVAEEMASAGISAIRLADPLELLATQAAAAAAAAATQPPHGPSTHEHHLHHAHWSPQPGPHTIMAPAGQGALAHQQDPGQEGIIASCGPSSLGQQGCNNDSWGGMEGAEEVEVAAGLRFLRPPLQVDVDPSGPAASPHAGCLPGTAGQGLLAAAPTTGQAFPGGSMSMSMSSPWGSPAATQLSCALELTLARLVAAAPPCVVAALGGQQVLQLAAGPGGTAALAAVRSRAGAQRVLATHGVRGCLDAVARALHANAARVVVERLRVAQVCASCVLVELCITFKYSTLLSQTNHVNIT